MQEQGQLHPRTSTPGVEEALSDFLTRSKCICCTVRVVELTNTRAVVEWGPIPYYTPAGVAAEFTYFTAENINKIRPEVLETFKGNEPREWVTERLRDSWLVEQLVYWVEFLNEWKYYREYYIYKEEFFEEEPEVLSPGCPECLTTEGDDSSSK